jgi:hypothetical protein
MFRKRELKSLVRNRNHTYPQKREWHSARCEEEVSSSIGAAGYRSAGLLTRPTGLGCLHPGTFEGRASPHHMLPSKGPARLCAKGSKCVETGRRCPSDLEGRAFAKHAYDSAKG